jgi:hypothetical protein
MTNHIKKIIAPVIITTIVVLNFFLIASVFLTEGIPPLVKMLILAFSLTFIAVAVYVLVERIKEIKKGDEDDLGKY